MSATVQGSLLGGTHAGRPAANATPIGATYSCTDHNLEYQTNGSVWSTRSTFGTTGAYAAGGTDVAVADGGTGASTASGARTNLGLVLGTDVASLTSGRVPIAQLASGTPDGTKFIRDDGVLATPAGGGGGGGLVLLEEHTAAASATIDFTTRNVTGQSGASFQSDFDDYLFEVVSMRPSTTNLLVVRCSVAGTFDIGSNYIYSHLVWGSAGSAVGGGTTTYMQLAPYAGRTLVTTANYAVSARMKLANPLGAFYKEFEGRSLAIDSATTNTQPVEFHGRYLSTSAIDGVRFLSVSGNFTVGEFRLYGLAK